MNIHIGLSENSRQAVAAALQQLLANEYALYTKTRNFHWNVEGIQFASLHSFFESQYEQLDEFIDSIAERIRALGVYAKASLSEYAAATTLTESGDMNGNAIHMLQSLLTDHEAVIRQLREYADLFGEQYGDEGSTDFVVGLLESHEKMAWMLRASLR